MSDMKKLFKSDSFYWLIVALIMLGLVTYMLLNFLGRDIKEHIENILRIVAEVDVIKMWAGGINICTNTSEEMMIGIAGTAFALQAIKMLFQETKNRTEVLNLFPVKSRNRLTYHYVSGLFIVGIPILIQMVVIQLNLIYFEKKYRIYCSDADCLWRCAAEAVIIFMLHYSLLILCRKLTNHIAGTIFTFAIVELIVVYWDIHTVGIPYWVFWVGAMIVTMVIIILSYIAEQKKDYARNGFYVFPIVHWIVMGIVFIEICYVFSGAYVNIPKVVSYLLTIVISLMITAGVHFLTKPKSI